jgi:beta-lactam-binding protein with PASTA domain
MPNVVGLLLQEAEQVLQQSGAVNVKKIGYFGTYPITVITVENQGRRVTLDGSRHHRLVGVVVAQTPPAGAAIIPNSPIVLTINEFATGFVFPGGANT